MDTFFVTLGANIIVLLWGLAIIRNTVSKTYGNFLHNLIKKNSDHKYKSVIAGLFATLLLQSSSATALITSSLASQNILNTTTGISMLLGADIGTAIIAQFLALKITWLSSALFITGYFFYKTNKKYAGIGEILIGIGFILLALQLTSNLTASIKSSQGLILVFGSLESSQVVAFICGIIITWLFHSSLAMILFISGISLTGMISPDLSIVFTLAANVGSGIIPLVISSQENAAAKRILYANFGCRLIFASILLALVPYLKDYLSLIGTNSALQVLHFHLLFNAALLILAFPFINRISKITEYIKDEEKNDDIFEPRFLHDDGLVDSSIGLSNATRETIRMGGLIEKMLIYTIGYLKEEKGYDEYEKVSEMGERADILYKQIRDYLLKVGQKGLSEQNGQRREQLMTYNINLGHANDIIESSLLTLAHRKTENGLKFSQQGQNEIISLYNQLLHNFQTAASLLMQPDKNNARDLMHAKTKFSHDIRQATDSHINRLETGISLSIETSNLHLDILRDFGRVNSHICSIAYSILESAGELYQSRLRKDVNIKTDSKKKRSS